MSYLPPLTGPVANDPFVDLLGAAIAGVTGLPGNLVRPSWQPNPPLRPGPAVSWCGFRLANMQSDADPVLRSNGAGTGYSLERFETGELAVSMYGPQADGYAGILRDGLQVPFNREALRAAGVATGAEGAKLHVPELIDDVWYDRVDITFGITREIRRTYLILSFVSSAGVIHGHGPDPTINEPFSVSQ